MRAQCSIREPFADKLAIRTEPGLPPQGRTVRAAPALPPGGGRLLFSLVLPARGGPPVAGRRDRPGKAEVNGM